MTKKELNAIKTAAYEAWAQGDDAKKLLSTTNYTMFPVYEISEESKVERVTLALDSQMNYQLLENHGFTKEARVTLLFTANRNTKTLERY